MTTVTRACSCAVFTLAFAAAALAQEPKSAELAKQLVAALDAGQLDSVAAKDPSGEDTFVGALYIKGFEMLVVQGKYSAPLILVDKLAKKDYREVYLDLNGAAQGKVFVEDLGSDGLKADHDNNTPFDAYEAAGKRTAFDGDWKKQQISEDDYKKTFATADESYSRMLTALLAQLKKSS